MRKTKRLDCHEAKASRKDKNGIIFKYRKTTVEMTWKIGYNHNKKYKFLQEKKNDRKQNNYNSSGIQWIIIQSLKWECQCISTNTIFLQLNFLSRTFLSWKLGNHFKYNNYLNHVKQVLTITNKIIMGEFLLLKILMKYFKRYWIHLTH